MYMIGYRKIGGFRFIIEDLRNWVEPFFIKIIEAFRSVIHVSDIYNIALVAHRGCIPEK